MYKAKLKTNIDNFLKYLNKHTLVFSIIITVCLIVFGLFLGWYNNRVVPINPAPLAHYIPKSDIHFRFTSNWDGPNYLNISKHGYVSSSSTNFFPLYPLVVHGVRQIISSTLYSALIVSWTSLAGAIYFYFKVLKKLFKVSDNIDALKGLLFFLLFPTGVFLLATYTESLFAFLALAAIYFVLDKKYLVASAFALFAGATHITGIFLLVLLFFMMLEQKLKILKAIEYIFIGCLGLIVYMSYLFDKFSNPFSFIVAQKAHGWVQRGYFHNLANTITIFNVLFIILLLITIFYWWNRKKSFSIYSATFLLIPITGGQFGGFDRYILMAFPLQFMLFQTLKKHNLAYPLALSGSAILWTYTLLQYFGGFTGS